MLRSAMFLPRLLLIGLLTISSAFSLTASEWIKKGDAFEADGKPQQALEAYQNAEKTKPDDAALLVKMPSLGGAAKKNASFKSLEYSRKAVAANPKSSDSHLALALSLGKNTEFMGSRQKIEASREMKTAADTALRLNSKSDYAHHMLGRWHQEMAGIGGATRALAKIIYGGVPKGTYQEALEHFESARKINNRRLIHQIEYGRTLAMMGRDAEAKTEIQKGLDMPNREADDKDSKARGRETLNSL
jgi:tetratricopeptide (TPR) repeat protein